MKNENELRVELNEMWQGATLRDLSDRLGLSTGFLHDVIRGRRNITPKLAAKLGYRVEVTKTVERKFFPLDSQKSAKSV